MKSFTVRQSKPLEPKAVEKLFDYVYSHAPDDTVRFISCFWASILTSFPDLDPFRLVIFFYITRLFSSVLTCYHTTQEILKAAVSATFPIMLQHMLSVTHWYAHQFSQSILQGDPFPATYSTIYASTHSRLSLFRTKLSPI